MSDAEIVPMRLHASFESNCADLVLLELRRVEEIPTAGLQGGQDYSDRPQQTDTRLYDLSNDYLQLFRGNKEYRGKKVSIVDNPVIVAKMDYTQQGQRVCVIHAIINEKIVFDESAIFHW